MWFWTDADSAVIKTGADPPEMSWDDVGRNMPDRAKLAWDFITDIAFFGQYLREDIQMKKDSYNSSKGTRYHSSKSLRSGKLECEFG